MSHKHAICNLLINIMWDPLLHGPTCTCSQGFKDKFSGCRKNILCVSPFNLNWRSGASHIRLLKLHCDLVMQRRHRTWPLGLVRKRLLQTAAYGRQLAWLWHAGSADLQLQEVDPALRCTVHGCVSCLNLLLQYAPVQIMASAISD